MRPQARERHLLPEGILCTRPSGSGRAWIVGEGWSDLRFTVRADSLQQLEEKLRAHKKWPQLLERAQAHGSSLVAAAAVVSAPVASTATESSAPTAAAAEVDSAADGVEPHCKRARLCGSFGDAGSVGAADGMGAVAAGSWTPSAMAAAAVSVADTSAVLGVEEVHQSNSSTTNDADENAAAYRRSGRARAASERFCASTYSTFSAYEARRVGQRHKRVRHESYEELQDRAKRLKRGLEKCKLKQQQNATKIRELMDEMNSRVNELGSVIGSEWMECSEQLQQAALELFDEPEVAQVHIRCSPAPGGGGICSTRLHVRVSHGSADDPHDEGTPASSLEPARAAAGANDAVGSSLEATRDGRAGKLLLNATHLKWLAVQSHEPELVLPLASIKNVGSHSVQLTPFTRGQRISIQHEKHTFVFQSTNGRPGGAATFAEQLRKDAEAASLIKGITPCEEVEPQPAAEAAAGNSSIRLTARVKAGRLLRSKLQEIARLEAAGKLRAAQEERESLNSSSALPMDAASITKQSNLAKQRVRELRDVAFSFGDLSLTKEIVERFLNVPEVRVLLSKESSGRKERVDAETAGVLLDTAKNFISKMFQTRGRLSDVNRNAMAACLAELLPANLFKDHRGRSACRILGISYRRAKRHSELNGQLLKDGASGWKLVETSTHFDNVAKSAAPIKEFFHSELFSTPDNQNKQMVRNDNYNNQAHDNLTRLALLVPKKGRVSGRVGGR